jgi:hypothetical protein
LGVSAKPPQQAEPLELPEAPEPAREPEPWSVAHRSYAGWVPNIRSHLSFSLIGAAKSARSFTHRAIDTPTRIVLILQKRVINDYPYPERIALHFHPDILGRWFMEAETAVTDLPYLRDKKLISEPDRQGLLRGTVRLLPYHEDPDAERHLQETLDDLAQLLATPRQLKTGNDVRQLQKEAVDLVTAAGSSIPFEFALMRTGECRLWFSEAIPNLDDADHDRLAEQAYYFIKDMVHDHTHHDPTSDQITPLTLFDASKNEEGHDDEVKWRRETMWSLSREIERLNREGKVTDQQRALGIVAYAEEFQASLMSHVRDASDPRGFRENTELHAFDFDHLKSSIKAVVDVRAARIAHKIQLTIAGVTIFVSTMALISSSVGTHNGALPRPAGGGASPEAIQLGFNEIFLRVLAENPILNAGLFALAVLSILVFFAKEGAVGLRSEPQRVLSQLARAAAISASNSTWFTKVLGTALNLFFAALATVPCYVLMRLIAGGGSW